MQISGFHQEAFPFVDHFQVRLIFIFLIIILSIYTTIAVVVVGVVMTVVVVAVVVVVVIGVEVVAIMIMGLLLYEKQVDNMFHKKRNTQKYCCLINSLEQIFSLS